MSRVIREVKLETDPSILIQLVPCPTNHGTSSVRGFAVIKGITQTGRKWSRDVHATFDTIDMFIWGFASFVPPSLPRLLGAL